MSLQELGLVGYLGLFCFVFRIVRDHNSVKGDERVREGVARTDLAQDLAEIHMDDPTSPPSEPLYAPLLPLPLPIEARLPTILGGITDEPVLEDEIEHGQ